VATDQALTDPFQVEKEARAPTVLEETRAHTETSEKVRALRVQMCIYLGKDTSHLKSIYIF